MIDLFESLLANCSLILLDLEGNCIKSKGAVKIGEVLKTNTTLTDLSLECLSYYCMKWTQS